MSTPHDRWLLDDARPVQSLKKAAAAPDGVRAFRLQNKVHALPDALRALRGLEVLVLRSTELTHFPAWLPELASLRALDLGGCAPSLYTDAELARLADLPQLEEIALEFTQLHNPAAFARLPRLRRLRLRSAGLAAIPDAWRALGSLAALDLWGNALTALPDFLQGLPLASLMLDNNKLRELPAWLVTMPTLRRLSLHGNQLTALPPIPADTALLELSLGFNPIPWATIHALRAALPGRHVFFQSHEPEPTEPPPEPLRVLGLPDLPPAPPRPALDLSAVCSLQPLRLDPPGGLVAPPTWSPDGRWLALVQDQRILVVDVTTLAPDIPPTFTCVAETDDEFVSAHFTATHLVVQQIGGSVHALDLARRTVAWSTDRGDAEGEWHHLVAHPGDPRLLVAHDGELRVRGADGELLAMLPCEHSLRRAALHPDGLALIEQYSEPLTLWRLDDPPQPLFTADTSGLCGAVAPAAAHLALGDTFDISLADRTGARIRTARVLDRVQHEQLQQLAFSPDGAWLASATWDGSVALWRTADLEPVRVLGGGAPGLRTVAFDPRGTMLATSDLERRVHVWLPRPEPTIPAPTFLPLFDSFTVDEVAQIKLSWGLVIAAPSRLRDACRLRVQPPPGDYRLFVAFAQNTPVAALLARGTPAVLAQVARFIAAARLDGRPAVELVDHRLALLDAALAHEFIGDRDQARSGRAEVESQWDEFGWVHHRFRLRVWDGWDLRLGPGRMIGLRLDLPDGPRPAAWGLSADGLPLCLLIDLATVEST